MSFLGSIFSPKPEKAENRAFGQISSTYGPQMQQGVGATNFLSGLLGVPGGNAEGAQAGFKSYLGNAGFSNALREMQRGVTGNQAAAGMLNSGSTQRRLLQEGSKINQGYYDNYMQHLSGLSKLGLEGGNLVTQAGQTKTGGSPSTASNIGSAIKTGLSIASMFSDRRLKTDVVKVAELPDGLGVYDYRYEGYPALVRGVMADEVAALRPWALGTPFMGYSTVNYGAL